MIEIMRHRPETNAPERGHDDGITLRTMALTPSTMVPLGTPAPDFDLPDTEGRQVTLADFGESRALLVVFMCNHCPYVKHVAGELPKLHRDYRELGLAMVGINSNDADNHPEDSPEKMRQEVERRGYEFPYLFDANQAVARAYGAACTPDFFLFDWPRRLVYRGQLDDSRPGNAVPVTGADLRAAIDAVLNDQKPSAKQVPSMGCNIKWRR
jgi:peroxiredoxin